MLDEIEQLDNDLKAKGWGVKSIVEIEVLLNFCVFFKCFTVTVNGFS